LRRREFVRCVGKRTRRRTTSAAAGDPERNRVSSGGQPDLASLPTSCREDRFKVCERAPCCPSRLRLVDRTIRAQVDLISACFGHERYRARVLTGPRTTACGSPRFRVRRCVRLSAIRPDRGDQGSRNSRRRRSGSRHPARPPSRTRGWSLLEYRSSRRLRCLVARREMYVTSSIHSAPADA